MKPKSIKKIEANLAGIAVIVAQLPKRERDTLKRHLDSLTESNCWWVLYRSRNLIGDLIECVAESKAKKKLL